ncbi:MAG: glycosyltransferase family 39 protein [Candidatus Saccharimonadales bacterium]
MISRLLKRLHGAKKRTWFERHFMIVVGAGAVIAATISLLIGLHQSVWFDEAYSIMLAKQPITQLVHLTAMDTHPPLYYLLLKAWAALFGWSELALRSLSVLALAGAVWFAGLLIKRTFGIRAALITLPFVVFAPFLLRYGFEIRMYALASFIGVAATYVLVAALQTKQTHKQWVLFAVYGLLVVIGMYTLYYMALLWIAHVTWLMWLTVQQKQPLFRSRWLLAYAGSIVLFLPWLPTFLSQVNNGALGPIAHQLTTTNLVSIVSFSFLYRPAWQLGGLLSLVMLFVMIVITYMAIQAFKYTTKNQRPYLVLLALYILVPVLLLALISMVKPMYTERYVSHIIIGGSLFIGAATAVTLQRTHAVKVKIMAALLIVISLLGVINLAREGNYNYQRLQKPAANKVRSLIGGDCRHTTLVASDPYVAIELSYYFSDCPVYFYGDPARLTGGYAPLAGSPLRVTNAAETFSHVRRLVYVYQTSSQLIVLDSLPLDQVMNRDFDSLYVTVFARQ